MTEFVWHKNKVFALNKTTMTLTRGTKNKTLETTRDPIVVPELQVGDRVWVWDWCFWDDTRGIVDSSWHRGRQLVRVTGHCPNNYEHNIFVDGQKVLKAACIQALPDRLHQALHRAKVDMRSNTSVPF